MAITPINVGTVANDGTGDPIRQAMQKVNANEAELDSRLTQAEADIGNLDKSDVGLGNVDNTADADKPISTAAQAALNDKVDKVTGKGLSTEDYTTDEKNKLSGIQSGAQVNTVTSVAGKTGAVSLVKDDVGLGNVDNTADADKPVSTAMQAALDQKVNESLLGVADGVATLDSGGKVPATQLPSYVDDVLEFTDLAAFPATGEGGKIYVALDTNKTYRWSGSEYIYITSGAVDSVAGKTGVVTLVKSDVGLGNVNNTSDADKPVSTAVQAALDAKVDKVTGKGLSTEDYTTDEKNKLAGIAENATANSSDLYLLNSANHAYDPVDSDLPSSTSKTKGAIDILSFGIERLIRPDDEGPCLLKTGADTLSVKAGTRVPVLGVKFDADTAITMPTLTAGSDYSVWVHPDGTASAVADPFTSPATAPVADAVKIGGFHYGLVASGTTPASGGFSTSGVTSGGGSFGWTQADVDKIAGVNEFSIWDLTWRCAGEQRGMAFDPLKQMWAGIYLMSDSPHIHGPSAYNTNVASGTVLPFIPPEWGGNGVLKYSRLSAFEAHELVSAFGLRLPTFEEFMSFAFGVTEATSLGGAAVTIAATLRQPGFTSRIGIEQATGHQWIVGAPIHSTAGTAYTDVGRGQYYATGGLVLLGGHRADAAVSGSRCAVFSLALSFSNWAVGVRAAGDHINLGRAAR